MSVSHDVSGCAADIGQRQGGGIDATALRDFLDQILPPAVVAAIDRADKPRPDLITAIGRRGFFRACFNIASGGRVPMLRLNLPAFAALIHELALTNCWGITLSIALHVGVFIPMVARLRQGGQRDAVVDAAIAGEALGTVAITDGQAAGSDFMGMETTAIVDGSTIRLRGEKTFLTSATIAEYAVVFARWRPGRHFANFCAVLVPIDHPGISRAPISMAVMRGAGLGSLRFADAELPGDALLGRRELGMRYFLDHIGVERLVGGVWGLAVAEQCLHDTQRYAAERRVGSQTLWQRGAVRQRFAEAVVELFKLRALVSETIARAQESGSVDPLRCAAIKAAVPSVMERLIGGCLQLQGARGLQADSALLRFLNEVRAFGIGGGSTETMLEVIADLWPQSPYRVS
jgi:citronellyl-CoA dehydrogenase